METTKKLSVNTAVCDMTEITEERLSQYAEININAVKCPNCTADLN